MRKFVGVFLLSVLAAFIGAGIYASFFTQKSVYYIRQEGLQSSFPKFPSSDQHAGTSSVDFPNFVHASQAALTAVVHIRSSFEGKKKNKRNDFFGNPWKDYFDDFDPYDKKYGVASGSGVIISEDGYIATNNHVIENANELEVTLYDNRSYKAKIIGTDVNTDLALIKIEAEELPYLPFGNSDLVQIGQWVLAVGNPMDLNSTVTAGIVSAKGRNLNLLRGESQYAIESFIQTDAVVNRGNSGGALVNAGGEIIGINTAIASQTGYYAGYSFAIPSTIVKKVMEDLLTFGKVQRGILGVEIAPVDSRLAEQHNLNVLKGAYVRSVRPNSGADEAGIREGDVIVSVNEISVANSSELQEQVSRFRPGDEIQIHIFRGENEKIFPVELKAIESDVTFRRTGPQSDEEQSDEFDKPSGEPDKHKLRFEFEWKDNTFRLLQTFEYEKYDLSQGIMVEVPGKMLKEAGIRKGFVITEIDGKKIRNLDQLEEILDQMEAKIILKGKYKKGRAKTIRIEK